MSARPPFRSVNWTTGMLLMPEHFLQQEAYFDESATWALRYLSNASGLVGGGIRRVAGDAFLEGLDPRFAVDQEGEMLRVSVREVRGVTPSGRIVEVTEPDALEGWFEQELKWGQNEFYLAVVHTGDKEEDAETVGLDPANEAQAAFRRAQHVVTLVTRPEEIEHSLVIGRVRRSTGTGHFERDDSYIPPCVSVLAHSRLYRAWSDLQGQLQQLSLTWTAAYREAAYFLGALDRWHLQSLVDHSILALVERAAFAVEACVHEVSNPALPPERMLQQIERAGARIAAALHLVAFSPEFRQLVPEVEPLIERLQAEERSPLAGWQGADSRRDLRERLDRAEQAISRIQRLVLAIRERYMDYRLNRVLPGLPFLVEAATNRVFVARKKVTAAGQSGDARSFVFSELDGAGTYRVVLVGDPEGEPHGGSGGPVQATVTETYASGPTRPTSATSTCDFPGEQRNFAVDLELGEGVLSLRVDVPRGEWFPLAILYRLKDKTTPSRAEPAREREPARSGEPRPAEPGPSGPKKRSPFEVSI